MKKKLNYTICFAISILLLGCNKNSLVEGVSTQGTELVLNKTFSLTRSASFSFSAVLSNSQVANFGLQTVATRGFATTSAYTINDSLQYIQFYPPNEINFAFSNFCLNKYVLGADVSSIVYAPSTNANFINFSKRIPPFNSPYSSITSTFTITGFGTIAPKFKLNDNGYIVYRRLFINSGATVVYEYGWIEISISQSSITFIRMAYRLGSPLKAGSLDD